MLRAKGNTEKVAMDNMVPQSTEAAHAGRLADGVLAHGEPSDLEDGESQVASALSQLRAHAALGGRGRRAGSCGGGCQLSTGFGQDGEHWTASFCRQEAGYANRDRKESRSPSTSGIAEMALPQPRSQPAGLNQAWLDTFYTPLSKVVCKLGEVESDTSGTGQTRDEGRTPQRNFAAAGSGSSAGRLKTPGSRGSYEIGEGLQYL